ncbi:hypothetical protein Hypma_006949 [Hypsizygus marmoreus]|uniref:Uncharacterized protein n=1 Tax=Hypsizygus marmoreus TaxID=39966 RepID=A0A369JYV4_HYPMA|nr:hypothetical protein Hypma_006949 [Hypsizygus marmoreus]
MPRPILYNTPEEKSAANRAKSARHYERNKALISAKRSVTYRDQRKRPTGLSYWCGRVEQVEVRLRKLLGGNPHSYIDAICKSYLTSRSKDDIRDKILAFTPMQKSIVRYEDEILGLAGVVTRARQALISRSDSPAVGLTHGPTKVDTVGTTDNLASQTSSSFLSNEDGKKTSADTSKRIVRVQYHRRKLQEPRVQTGTSATSSKSFKSSKTLTEKLESAEHKSDYCKLSLPEARPSNRELP